MLLSKGAVPFLMCSMLFQVWRYHCGQPKSFVETTAVESFADILQGTARSSGRAAGQP